MADASQSSSPVSYKSTHSSRSSVLERAREYNRRIDEQKILNNYGTVGANQSFNEVYHMKHSHYYDRRRSKSLERGSEAAGDSVAATESSASQQRSQSAGRAPQGEMLRYPTSSPTRNRAMASVQKQYRPPANTSSLGVATASHKGNDHARLAPEKMESQAPQQRYTSHTPPPSSQLRPRSADTPTTATTTTQSSQHRHHHHPPPNKARNSTSTKDEKKDEAHAVPPAPGGPVVTPELLVDALSGHEDGLLAIAEKLMEHYDSGYDVMGEAIIDAFADVQKLFQHVVEAAHMEGAAFEAARRDEEQKQRQKDGRLRGDSSVVTSEQRHPATPGSPSGPTRHDEFIDQDVKDVLADAIRQGSILRNERKDLECYHLYTAACQDASSLLPVDSDHRGRLQLSIARAESMSPDRACAILRYAMDDVLRSGLQAHHPTPIPDPSHRADVVLHRNLATSTGNNAVVQQSSDEALASLMEELKEILQAPIYHDTPLQHVASRFWTALSESQKIQHRNESRLEQSLGKLKGEFLLARAEWEEKLNQSNNNAESYKKKYERLLETGRSEGPTERSRSLKATDHDDGLPYSSNIDLSSVYGSVKSAASKAETVASGVSGFAQHARSLVMNSGFNCVAPSSSRSDRNDDDDDDDIHANDDSEFDANPRPTPSSRGRSTQERSRSRPKTNTTTASHNPRFQEYSRSPHRVDI